MKVKNYLFQNGKWNQALDLAMDSPNTVLMVFGNDKKVARELIGKFPKSLVFGGSTAGNIVKTNHTTDVSVTAVHFENSKIKMFVSDVSSYEKAFDVGKASMQALYGGNEKPSCCLVMVTGFVNGNKVVKGMHEISKGTVNIFGGMAGDPEIKNTWIYTREGEKESGVVTIGSI